MTLRRLLFAAILAPLLLAAACKSDDACPTCTDIVTTIPWSAPESHTYRLKDGDKDRGQAVLSVKQDGDRLVFTQSFTDDKNNSDESSVTVDGATLKPQSSTRTVIDSELRKLAETSYEDVETGKCSSGRIANIKQSTFKPPSAEKADSTRSSPLCVPDHSYDNDTSLFIWRTIKFEKGYIVSYRTVLANRRSTQMVTLNVREQVKVETSAGEVDAWVVDIQADTRTQRAWFAATPDHRLLRYNNDSLVFEIEEN